MSNHTHTQGNLPQLIPTNFSYWYDALVIHARTIDAHEQLANQATATTDPTIQTPLQRKEDQLRKAIMQSLSPEVVKLLPTHILRHNPHNICATIKQTVDKCSVENHELLDAEARNLKYTTGQNITDYISKHRGIRHRMQVSSYPNIETERTTVRYMVQGLAYHPDMHALAVVLACNPPTTIQEFTNHLQQVQLIQGQAPKNRITLMEITPTPPAQTTTRTRAPCTKPRTPSRHYDKPAGHTGTWCHHHGCVTHSTANCFARRKSTAQAKQASASPDNEQQEGGISDLKNASNSWRTCLQSSKKPTTVRQNSSLTPELTPRIPPHPTRICN